MARFMQTTRHPRSVPCPPPRGPIPSSDSLLPVAALPLFVITSPEEPFPFTSLPLEIRLMVYNAAMPEDFYFCRTGPFPTGISPTIRALMAVNVIRDELIPYIFRSRHFHWVENMSVWRYRFRNNQDDFRRHVAGPVHDLTFWFPGPLAPSEADPPRHPLNEFLSWARWRSQRPHLHPWNLKRLTLAERYDLFPRKDDMPLPFTSAQRSRAADQFLVSFPVVLGLELFKVVFSCRAGEEAMKEFLERCASCDTEGRVGFSQAGDGKASEWFYLRDNQVVRSAA